MIVDQIVNIRKAQVNQQQQKKQKPNDPIQSDPKWLDLKENLVSNRLC